MKKRGLLKRFLAAVLVLVLIAVNNSDFGWVLADEAKNQEQQQGNNQEFDLTEAGAPAEDDAADTAADESAAADGADNSGTAAGTGAQLKSTAEMVSPVNEDTSAGTIIFGLEAKVDKTSVATGDTFRYTMAYTVPVTGNDNYNYNQMKIEIYIPEGLTILQQEGLYATGADVAKSTYNSTTRMLTIVLGSVTSGTSSDIVIDFRIDNYMTENGTQFILDPQLSGKAGSSNVTGSLTDTKKENTTVTAVAKDDGWKVEKTSGAVTTIEEEGQEYFLVPYTIKTQNIGNEERNGRLHVESFVLSDLLPSAGLPAGGEAVDIVSVKITNPTTSSSSLILAENTDYTVERSGDSVTGLTITASNHITEERAEKSDYLKAGEVTGTTYEVVVKYPVEPYITPSNKTLIEYKLTNTANLTYKLLASNEVTVTDTDEKVYLSKKEVTTGHDLAVEKYITVAGVDYKLTAKVQSALGITGGTKFTLFEDAECTTPATDYQGNSLTNPAAVGDDGTIVFKELRFGTYYLKETTVPGGVDNPGGAVAVQVSTLGAVTIADAGNYRVEVDETTNIIKVYNETTQYGAVEFEKVTKDPLGRYASAEGYEFTLTSADGRKTYTAASDSGGKVSFPYLPAGEYLLKETGKPSGASDYTIDPNQAGILVSVQNGQISKPAATSDGSSTVASISAEDIQGTGLNEGVFLNVSDKGRMKVIKEDASDGIKLAGAKFEIYGPFASENEAKTDDLSVSKGTLTTGSTGIALSDYLEKGWYVLKETAAPTGYLAASELTYVKVVSNEEITVTVENSRAVEVWFSKYGQLAGTAVEEELTGAEFRLYYDAEATRPVCDEDGSPVDFVTVSDGLTRSKSNSVLVTPGTYYYKETKAPDDYKINHAIVEVTIEGGSNWTHEIRVIDIAKKGRIELIKIDSLNSSVKLSGAKFGLYYDQGGQNPVLDGNGTPITLVTGQDGTAASELLDEGTYYLIEIEAPEGYQARAEALEVNVAANNLVEVEAKNDQLAQIKVIKTDSETGQPVAGATFGIYNPADLITPLATAVTNAQGVAVFTGINRGTQYVVKEISAPAGYIKSEISQIVTTAEAGSGSPEISLITEVEFENVRAGKIVVQKQTKMDANAAVNMTGIDNIQFELYKSNAGGDLLDGPLTAKFIDAVTGQVFFDGLEPGYYAVVESFDGTVDGYTEPGGSAAKTIIEVTAGMNQSGYTTMVTNVINTPTSGKLKINKVDKNNTGKKLQGAKFQLYSSADGGSTWTEVGDLMITDAEGCIETGWLDPSGAVIYKVVEVEAPSGYTIDATELNVVIAAAETAEYTFTNTEQGKLIINKVGEFAVSGAEPVTYPLAGAKFMLIPKTGAGYQIDVENGYANGIIVSDNKTATQISPFLDAGEYWVVEIEVPDDYTASGIGSVEIGEQTIYVMDSVTIEHGDTEEITVTNDAKAGKIQVEKHDEDTGTPLGGAEFIIYVDAGDPDLPDSVKLASNVTITVWMYTATGEIAETVTAENEEIYGNLAGFEKKTLTAIYASGSSDGAGLMLQTNDDGTVYTLDLAPYGRYYILESKAPGGYHATSEWTGPVDVLEGEQTQISIANPKSDDGGENPDPGEGGENGGIGRFKVWKYTSILGLEYAVKGVQFAAYRAEAVEAGEPADYYGEDGAGYKKTSEVPAATGTSDENGLYTSILLSSGTYIVEEIGINQDNEIVEIGAGSTLYQIVTITRGDKGDEVNAKFYNPATQGKFYFRKADDLGQTITSASANFTFTLQKKSDAGDWYDVEGYTNFTVKGTDAFESGFLPTGDYRLEEITAASGYTKAADYYYFTIDKGALTGGDSGHQIKILDDGDAKEPFYVYNDRQGTLNLQKVGVFEGDTSGDKPLAGVVFYVYSDALCNTLVKTLTATNAAGNASSLLDAGIYYVVEGLPAGLASKYTAAYTKLNPLVVTILKGETTDYTSGSNNGAIKNKTTYGKIKITKVDSYTRNGINAKFGIYSDAACTVPVVDYNGTNAVISAAAAANGVGVSELIPASSGGYYLKELSADGYIIPTDAVYGPYTVVSNELTTVSDEIENDISLTVQVKKTTTGGTALEGAVIGLYSDSACDALVAQLTTGSDGMAIFKNISVGSGGVREYYLKEISAPTGYELSDEVKTVKVMHPDYQDNQDNTVVFSAGELINQHYGTIRLQKVGKWDNSQVPLAAVEFKVYKTTGNYIYHSSENDYVETITTNNNGIGNSAETGLEAGWYELVETVTAEGYQLLEISLWVEVKNDQTNTYYTSAGNGGVIVNTANKGIAVITKYDGSADADQSRLTILDNARFMVYYSKTGADGSWEERDNITVSQSGTPGVYKSVAIEPGFYKLHEIQTPQYLNGSDVIEFSAGEDVIFEIEAGITKPVNVYNSPKGHIQLTKYGVDASGDAEKVLLPGVTFQLYRDVNCTGGNEVGSAVTTDSQGAALWKNIDPGTYWIKEVSTVDGYKLNTEVQKVIVKEGLLVKDIVDDANTALVTYEMDNQADKGRFYIRKEDEAGNPLSGAEFEIYDQSGAKVDTVTVGADGAYSILLPAAKNGTDYTIKEVKAPDGYSLDGTFYELERIVTLYPYHNRSEIGAADAQYYNKAVFKNRAIQDIASFGSGINKTVKNAGGSSYTDASEAERSLLEADYTVDYKIDGYASEDQQNEIGASTFTITDNSFTFQKMQSGSYVDITNSSQMPDYTINSLTINDSYNRLEDGSGQLVRDTGNAVAAKVYVQKVKGGAFELVNTILLDDSTAKLVSFSYPVYGIKVEYQNVAANFVSKGILMNVTFSRQESSAENPEIRRIVNRAALEWQDKIKDEEGNIIIDKKTYRDHAVSDIPSSQANLPYVEIVNAFDGNNTYNPGDLVSYQTTVTNHVMEGQDAKFYDPIVSIKLPAELSLNQSMFGDGVPFDYYIVKADGTRVAITITPTIVETQTSGISEQDGDNFIASSDTTTQYTFTFPGLEMEPGERLIIKYSGYVGYGIENATDKTMICPAFLSSDKVIAKSEENPYGLSFLGYDPNAHMYLNDVANEATDNELLYLQSSVSAKITSAQSIKLVKEVSSDPDSGYEAMGSTAKVIPGKNLYYRITLYNYSTAPLSQIRIVDILPFNGDTYVLPLNQSSYINRGSTIPAGDGYERVQFVSAGSASSKGTPTFYYSYNDWSQRDASQETSASGELGMMYYQGSDWNSWSATADSNATAVGANVIFDQSDLLQPGESYTIEICIKAPGYSAEQKEEYTSKVMANSAAASVIQYGYEDENGEISINNRVEPKRVLAELYLPTGSIGDYVWFDGNQNGLQDEGEEPAEGANVILTQNKTYMVGGIKRMMTTTRAVTTDQNGYYLFEDLPCNVMKEGAVDKNDPKSYIGEVFYKYTVTFSYPGYAPTIKNAGSDTDIDSDANPDGTTDIIELNVLQVEDDGYQTLIGEDRTDIDAGLIEPYALGNRVWYDENYNGLQDEGEEGVANAVVRLYRVNNGEAESIPLDTTKTDADGYYWFTGLAAGDYVVEYDLTDLVQDGTQSVYLYDFTMARATTLDGEESVWDSDAVNPQDAEEQVMRTNIITVSKDAFGSGYTDTGAETPEGYDKRQIDSRWDAGVVLYSALGGYVFDDQNYNNLRDLMIPLEGTAVELYEIDEAGKIGEAPIAQTTVGEDGTYYFGHLKFAGSTQAYTVKFTYPEGYKGVLANQDTDDGTSNPADDSAIDSDVDRFEDETGNVGWISRIDLPRGTTSTTWDAGAGKYASIGDLVWVDSDMDGTQYNAEGEREAGVADVRVVLQVREDTGSTWDYAGETVTDADGLYEFTGLKSSSYINTEYRVVFALGATTQMTRLNAGEDRAIDSDALLTYQSDIIPASVGGDDRGGYVTAAIKPGYGQEDMAWDAGIIRSLSALGYYVWLDTNYNGIQDADEAGVEGINVILEAYRAATTAASAGSMVMATAATTSAEWTVYGTTVTDAAGHYMFEELPAGYYRVKFEIPDQYVKTQYNLGNADEDSDASRLETDNWAYSRSFYLEAGTVDLTWDAGLYIPQTIEEVITKKETEVRPRIIHKVETKKVTNTKTVTTTSSTSGTVKTGDSSHAKLWLIIAGIALAIGGYAVFRRRRKNSDE